MASQPVNNPEEESVIFATDGDAACVYLGGEVYSVSLASVAPGDLYRHLVFAPLPQLSEKARTHFEASFAVQVRAAPSTARLSSFPVVEMLPPTLRERVWWAILDHLPHLHWPICWRKYHGT